ncbi:MAG: SpoIIE family protein phosphatase [Bacteroidales bacterium]|nr:SpoIIE family protein phosphatase [Bacteroidales bacterium]
MRYLYIFWIVMLSAVCQNAFGQIKQSGSPYVRNYTAKDFPANNQNWCILTDTLGVMYFGNTNGVLIFDGITWNLIKTPKKTAVRALALDKEKNSVYVGSANDFGYLKPDSAGSLKYQTLTDSVIAKKNPNITSIVKTKNEGVIFETAQELYILKDDGRLSTVTLPVDKIAVKPEDGTRFKGVFEVGDKVYVNHTGAGIMELKAGALFRDIDLIRAGHDIYAMIQVGDSIIIINREEGIFVGDNLNCHKFENELTPLILKDVYCVLRLHDGCFAFGTISKGLIITDKYLNVIKTGLLKHYQIYNLFEDSSNLVWAATNNGLAVVDLYSPFSHFPNNATGISGTIRSVLSYNGMVYLGTDAVYACPIDSLNEPHFKELKNQSGRSAVWKLDTVGGSVIGGTNLGLISIKNGVLTNVDRDRNIFNFVIPKENPNLMVAVGGSGFTVYECKDGVWAHKNGVEGFDFRVRNIAQDSKGAYWVSEKSTGVYQVHFNKNFNYVQDIKNYNSGKGLPSAIGNYLFDTGKELVIGTSDGFYKYSKDSDKFFKYDAMNEAFNNNVGYEFMYTDPLDNIWIKRVISNKKDPNVQHWLLERYKYDGDSQAECLAAPFLPYADHIYSIGYVGDSCYIIGDQDGYVHYDEKIKKDFSIPYKALIRNVENIANDSILAGEAFEKKVLVLPYSERSIRIAFSAASYEYPEFLRFKTYMENNDDGWTDFRNETVKEYSNLSPGTYVFHVIAKNCYDNESQEATLTIKIIAPWYMSLWAVIFYVLVFALLIWLIVKAYTKKLIRDKQKLEQIVEQRTAEIRQQSKLIMEKNEEITEKNKSITDSIEYALHIQQAMLPLKDKIDNALPINFILYRPKDIVSGDYYWFAETDKKIIITAADCTGHGVPGAFMSMIGSQILTEIISDGITSADEILTNQNFRIRKALKQDTTENHDGMDMALCSIDKETHLVEYAGAKNPLIFIQNEEIQTIKADKQAIGGDQIQEDFHFTKHEIMPDGNTWFYMFSDGYEDQFGGPDGKKFKIKNLRELIFKIHNLPPEQQREILNTTIEEWIGPQGEQTDDIILMGFKL